MLIKDLETDYEKVICNKDRMTDCKTEKTSGQFNKRTTP